MKKIEEIKNKIEKGIITHGGVFHADDVFSTALLQIMERNENLLPKRVFKVDETFNGLVYDIGLGDFDHHQADVACYENGKKKAAFGLLSEVILPELYGEEVYTSMLPFIQMLDESDNYGEVESLGSSRHPIAEAIGTFNPSWDSKEPSDEAFAKATSFARTILVNEINKTISTLRAKELVENAPEENGVKVLPCFAPWQDFVGESTRVVVFPALRGGYNIQTVDSKKYPLPKKWLENKPQGCTFVHQALFLGAFDTEENALSSAYEAVKTMTNIKEDE